MATITLKSTFGGLISDLHPIPPNQIPYTDVKKWTYENQPYIAGGRFQAPVQSGGSSSGISATGEAHHAPYDSIEGSQIITYPDDLVDANVSISGIYPFAPPIAGNAYPTGEPYSYSSAALNNQLSTGLLYSSLVFAYDVGDLDKARQELHVEATSYMEMQRKWNGIIEQRVTNRIQYNAPIGTAVWTFSAKEDVRVGRKRLYFRTLQNTIPELSEKTGYLNSSWVEFLMPPVAHAVLTLEDDQGLIDCTRSFDVDDGIDHFVFKFGYDLQDITSLFTEVSDRVFQFSLQAIRELTGAPLLAGQQFGVVVIAVDKSGLTGTTGVNAYIVDPARSRALVRPTGRIVGKVGHVLWQYKDEGHIYAMDMLTGYVLVSGDEGNNWSPMTPAWSNIPGARPLDACAMGFKGVGSIARLGNNIVFRYSPDRGQTWEAVKIVSPATTSLNSSWCIISHIAAGNDTATVTDQRTTSKDTENCGDDWTDSPTQS